MLHVNGKAIALCDTPLVLWFLLSTCISKKVSYGWKWTFDELYFLTNHELNFINLSYKILHCNPSNIIDTCKLSTNLMNYDGIYGCAFDVLTSQNYQNSSMIRFIMFEIWSIYFLPYFHNMEKPFWNCWLHKREVSNLKGRK